MRGQRRAEPRTRRPEHELDVRLAGSFCVDDEITVVDSAPPIPGRACHDVEESISPEGRDKHICTGKGIEY